MKNFALLRILNLQAYVCQRSKLSEDNAEKCTEPTFKFSTRNCAVCVFIAYNFCVGVKKQKQSFTTKEYVDLSKLETLEGTVGTGRQVQ